MRCDNCGNELYIGQKFCRNCGRPTTQLPAEESMPTQMMPGASEMPGARGYGDTAPASRPETSPVYAPPPAYYQPQVPPHPIPPYTPPRGRSPWGWIIALVSIGLFGIVMLAVLIGSRAFRRNMPPPRAERTQAGVNEIVPGPVINEGETRVFPLSAGAKVSVDNLSGNITITGWDEPRAQVTVTKSGGSPQERSRMNVTYTADTGNIALKTVPASSGNNRVQVAYEIKLPRTIGQVTITGASSDVHVSNLKGPISVEVASGSIELKDINGQITAESKSGDVTISDASGKVEAASASGSIEIKDLNGMLSATTASGDISATFIGVAAGQAMSFASASGSIELLFETDFNADFEAQTVSGDINVENIDNINVEKRVVGRSARGKIGTGGQLLEIKTASGDIQISRQA